MVPSGVAQNAAPAAALLPPQTISLPTYTTSATVNGTAYKYTRWWAATLAKGGTTTIPVLLVPVTLSFDGPVDTRRARRWCWDAGAIAQNVLHSPIFSKYAFGAGDTQYIDALMRTEFNSTGDWHTLLGTPKIAPVHISVPVWDGYVMTSKKTGGMLAMVDQLFMQQAIFAQLSNVTPGTLVIAITRDTTYYINYDATECWHVGQRMAWTLRSPTVRRLCWDRTWTRTRWT